MGGLVVLPGGRGGGLIQRHSAREGILRDERDALLGAIHRAMAGIETGVMSKQDIFCILRDAALAIGGYQAPVASLPCDCEPPGGGAA